MKYLLIVLLFFSLGASAQTSYTFQKSDCRLEILIGDQIRYSMQLGDLTWTNRIGGIEVKDGVTSLSCNGSQISNYAGDQVDSLMTQLGTWRLACLDGSRAIDSLVLVDSSLLVWELSSFPVQEVTLTGNSTLQVPTGMRDGQGYELLIYQDGTGSWTLSYTASYYFAGGTEPVITAAAGSLDILTCIYHERVAKMYCVIQQDFKQ